MFGIYILAAIIGGGLLLFSILTGDQDASHDVGGVDADASGLDLDAGGLDVEVDSAGVDEDHSVGQGHGLSGGRADLHPQHAAGAR